MIMFANPKGLGNPGEGGKREYDLEWIRVPAKIAEISKQGIKPGAEVSFHLEELIQRYLKPGEFLQIRGNTLYTGNPVPWWLQHEELN